MKLTLFLVFITVFQVSATNIFSQDKNISLDMQNVTARDVIQEIELQSGMNFFYNDKLSELSTMLNITMLDKPTQEALESALDQAGMTYEVIKDDFVVLLPARVPVQDQPIGVTGTVSDEDGNPIPGANIVVKGTTTGTISDTDGKYSVLAGENDVLVISFIGMLTQEVAVGSQTVIDVALGADHIGLDEVVVIGYGEMKRSDITGSVTSVNMEEMQASNPLTVVDALQGRAAGVQVSTGDGAPGGGVNIRIRGTSTINSSTEPLYIIDGMPVSSINRDFNIEGGNYEGSVEGSDVSKVDNNILASINPADIESIEILKDASATAIYGSKGANGVVLITTKKGKEGQTIINFQSNVGVNLKPMKYEKLSGPETARRANEAAVAGGTEVYYDGSTFYRPLPNETITTDWQDLCYQNAMTQDYNLNIAGGTANTRFNISGNYRDEEGTMTNSGFNRISTRINLEHDAKKWLTVGANFMASQMEYETNPTNSWGFNGVTNILGARVTQDPNWWIESDGRWWTDPDNVHAQTDPYNWLNEYSDNTVTTRLLGNVFARAHITKGLTFNVNAGVDMNQGERKTYFPRTLYQSSQYTGGHANIGSTGVNRSTLISYFSWNKDFGDHSISATAGFELQKQIKETRNMHSEGFVTDNQLTDNMQSGLDNIRVSTYKAQWTSAGFFGRINYDLKDKYYLTVNARYDGASRFGANSKWGFFPSVAGSWRLSEEDFIQNIEAISNMKLRASYGVTGNSEIGLYQSLPTWSLYGKRYSYDGVLVTSVELSRMVNPDLKWETTKQFNIGGDIGLFRNRLGVTLDYYVKNTEDLILMVKLPITSGFTSATQNVGTLQNKGFEFAIYGVPTTGEFKWDLNFNISFMSAMVTDLGDDKFIDVATLPRRGGIRLEVGKPAGLIYGYVHKDVFATQEEADAAPAHNGADRSGNVPGNYQYEDINGDGIINDNDKTAIGNVTPDFVFGFTNHFAYKGLELTLFIQGNYGNDIVMEYGARHASDFIADQWTAEDPYGKKWAANKTGFNGNIGKQTHSRDVYNGSYIRLKSARLAYTLPPEPLGMKIKLFVTGRNLITITNYPGYNPDVSSGGAYAFGEGMDVGVYPLSKGFDFGVNLIF